MNRRTTRALLSATLLSFAAMSAPAAAQQIDRIIVFGDSYADTGNFFRIAGINPLTTQIYTTGRFTGGSNYIDTLTNTLQVPMYNFAIGGARTNNLNQTAGVPGFTTETQVFLAGGGQLGFPTVDTALDRSDLVAISIGGNDSRAYQLGGGALAGAAASAATAVASFKQNADLILARGTPTISFLAGDTSLLPEVAGNTTGIAVRTAYSAAFNSGVQQVLAGYAAQGAVVHYLDLTTMLGQVNSNLAAYGLTAINCPALPNTTCVANSTAPYLFYIDGVHPTSAGSAIIGQYIARQLVAPYTLQAPADLGFDTARQWGRTLNSRSDLYGRSDTSTGLRIYALGDAFERSVGTSATNDAFDVRGSGGTIGLEYGMPGAAVGIAANYSRPTVNFSNDAAKIRAHSAQIGAYGSVSMGGLFGQAYLGYGRDTNRLTRVGVVQGMEAHPHGTHTVAGAKAGYLVGIAGLQAGPIVALDYARAKVNGYTEGGDPTLTLNVSRQTFKSWTGQAGLEVRGELSGLHPFLDVTAERNFGNRDRLITFSETAAPTIVNSWIIDDGKKTYARVAAGASANISGGVSVDAYVSTTFKRNHGQETGGNIGVKARF